MSTTISRGNWRRSPWRLLYKPAPNVNAFGRLGLKFVGNSNPERAAPTVIWLTNVGLAVQL